MRISARILVGVTLPCAALAACGGEISGGVAAPTPTVPAARPPALFAERAAELGLDFFHFNGMSGESYLAEITCGGGGLIDVDNDGDLDIYLGQGRMLGPGKTLDDALVPPRHPPPLHDRLYRNELVESGRLAFTDISAAAGLEVTTGYGCGVAAGDVDNDGWTDLLVLNLGANQLLLNRGGTFVDATAAADPDGGLSHDRSSVAAVFLDVDRDGWLDLFVANNVTFVYEDPPLCYDQTGAHDYCGPGAFQAEPDQLFRNVGGGDGRRGNGRRFTDATLTGGILRGGPALGATAADFNGDGWLDLYVANDGQANQLWIHQGAAAGGGDAFAFVDEAVLAGCGVNADGQAEASMGVDAADVDGDGDVDLFLTHLLKETNTLYLNDGQGFFSDRTLGSGLGAESLAFTSFGTAFFDYDNDGWLDLLVVNGAVRRMAELVRRDDPFPLHQPNQLFRNQGAMFQPGAGSRRFVETTAEAGPAFTLSEVSRGALFGDLDNDGDTDVVVVNNNGPVRLLDNRVGQDRPWLGLRLVGRVADGGVRDQLGARVVLWRGGRPAVHRRVRTDGSYNAAHDPRVVFGEPGAVERLVVHWPDGTSESFAAGDLELGRYNVLEKGRGQAASP